MAALYRPVLWLLVVSATACVAVPARGYDMDCKVILCLAGNFPPGCADARAYMLNRLRSFPPKPPFGHCAREDPSNFRIVRGREPFLPCAGGFRVNEQDNYRGRIVAATAPQKPGLRVPQHCWRSAQPGPMGGSTLRPFCSLLQERTVWTPIG